MKFWTTVELALGTIALAIIIALWFLPHQHVSVAIPLTATASTTPTLAVVDTATPLDTRVSALITAATTPPPQIASSTEAILPAAPPVSPIKTAVPKPVVAAAPKASAPVTTAATSTPAKAAPQVASTPSTPASTFAQSVVNILCITRDDSRPPVSGSGVIVSPNGVILTAAHIAQMFLLTDYPTPGNVTCTIRTGSPAKDAYTAKLIYISSTWIQNNPDTLLIQAPTESGEDDFALLAISGRTNGAALPASFPYVGLSTDDPTLGENVTVGSYGASSGTNIDAVLETIGPASVNDRYTFGMSSLDEISLTNNADIESGSSGGGVMNEAGALVGTIVTSTSASAHAITANYIRRSFAADMNVDLDSYIATPEPATLASAFSTRIASIAAVLKDALSGY